MSGMWTGRRSTAARPAAVVRSRACGCWLSYSPPPASGVVRRHVQEALLEQVERAVLGPAEPLAGLDDLVQHRLDPRAAGDGAQDAADRALLLAQILDLASELCVVGGHAGHPRSLGPAAARRVTA